MKGWLNKEKQWLLDAFRSYASYAHMHTGGAHHEAEVGRDVAV